MKKAATVLEFRLQRKVARLTCDVRVAEQMLEASNNRFEGCREARDTESRRAKDAEAEVVALRGELETLRGVAKHEAARVDALLSWLSK